MSGLSWVLYLSNVASNIGPTLASGGVVTLVSDPIQAAVLRAIDDALAKARGNAADTEGA